MSTGSKEQFFNQFKGTYEFANNLQEADEYLTTDQLYETLSLSNSNLPFDKDELHQWLSDEKYNTYTKDMITYWLFKTNNI